jgi:hypothetical protein
VFSVSAQARASGQGKARRSRDRLHGGILSSAASRGDFESPAGTSRGATDAGRDSSATRTSRAPRGLGCSVHRRAKARGAIVRIAVTDGASSLAHRPCSQTSQERSRRFAVSRGDFIPPRIPSIPSTEQLRYQVETVARFFSRRKHSKVRAEDPARPLSPAQSTRV